jgi:hypothetical protein
MLNISQSYWSQSRITLRLRLLLHQNDAALAQQRCLEEYYPIVAVMFFRKECENYKRAKKGHPNLKGRKYRDRVAENFAT